MKLPPHQIMALSLAGILSFFGCSKHGQEPPVSARSPGTPEPASSKPIDLAHWREIPCLTGRAATQEDVSAGRAVFAAPGTGSTPIALKLPRCAIHSDQQTGAKTPVIVVQAEIVKGNQTIGYRLLNGKEGLCLLSELELLDGPDSRFK